jgi:hypothetical protein
MVVKLFCIVKLRRYLKTATFFVNEASAKPVINQGYNKHPASLDGTLPCEGFVVLKFFCAKAFAAQ